jgi:hypothetical protein
MNDTVTPTQSAKRDKFQRIAVRRTKSAIKAVRNIATLGGRNRYSYEFSTADVENIADTLDKEVAHLRTVMLAPGRQTDIEFDL